VPRKGDATATLADISKARAILGWVPAVDFREGVEELKRVTKGG